MDDFRGSRRRDRLDANRLPVREGELIESDLIFVKWSEVSARIGQRARFYGDRIDSGDAPRHIATGWNHCLVKSVDRLNHFAVDCFADFSHASATVERNSKRSSLRNIKADLNGWKTYRFQLGGRRDAEGRQRIFTRDFPAPGSWQLLGQNGRGDRRTKQNRHNIERQAVHRIYSAD